MTTTQKRREKVLQQLNSRLLESPKFGLGVTGSKVPLLSSKGAHVYKPSRIPRPESSPRPLPPPGYVSETTAPLQPKEDTPNPWQPGPSQLGEGLSNITSQRTPPGKKLTIVIHANTSNDNSKDSANNSNKQHPRKSSSEAKRTKSTYVHSLQERTLKKPSKPSGGLKRVSTRQSGVSAPKAKRKYDWNKGGRQNELKIRFLARKYYIIWCRHVFGRVSPSSARHHYQVVLKRKALGVWHEQWWIARREWKLNIRAECHNRYRLWQLVWKAWTEHVEFSRIKKAKKEKAQACASLRLKKLAWKGWCEYTARRREKKALNLETMSWRQERMKRSTWQRWIGAVSERRHMFVMDTTALHHWAHTLQKRVWEWWLHCYREQLLTKQKLAIATLHHDKKLLLNCWAVWLTYIDSRRLKHHMRGVAVEHHSTGLVIKSFTCWKMRFFRAREIAEFRELVETKGETARLRRVFCSWKYYIALKHHRAYQYDLAILYYKVTLKSKALHSMVRYTLQQQQQVNRNQLARHFHVTKRVHQCWRKWLQRCEHCEEIKMGPQTRMARSHFASVLLGKVIEVWKVYIAHCRVRKRQYHAAEEHFRSVALPKYFSAMREHVAMCYYKRDLKETSATFRRETLLSMVFYKWWRASHFSQDIRMLERVAILHSEEVAKKKLWRLWQQRTKERIKHTEHEELAVDHYQFGLLSTAFQKWKERHQESLKSVHHTRRAAEHHGFKIVRRAWGAWTRYVAKRRVSHATTTCAVSHYHKSLLTNVLDAWKVYHSHRRVRNKKNSTAIQFYHCLLKRHALARWHSNVQVYRTHYRMEQEAVRHHVKRNLRKCFDEWRERTALSIEQTQLENKRVLEAREHLQRTKMILILTLWREHTERSIQEKMIMEKAELHHSRTVLEKCFAAWYDNHTLRLRKSLLQRQCAWFHNTRLLTMCYSKWRVELMNALILKRKSMLALWHWSQSLEKKVLVVWILYTSQKKRKAIRYAQATERHRNRLITIGVTQWIKMATEAKAQREETAMHQQVKNTQSKMKCVRKCALHWKAIVRKRRMQPSSQSPTSNYPQPLLTPKHPSSSHYAHDGQQKTMDSKMKPSPAESSDLWHSLVRKLQIPDAPVNRAPPRRTNYLAPTITTSALQSASFSSDVMPRPPIHPPPCSPPVLYPQRKGPARTHGDTTLTAEGSFTFLPSTCSEEPSLLACGTVQHKSPVQERSDDRNERQAEIEHAGVSADDIGSLTSVANARIEEQHGFQDQGRGFKGTQLLLPPSAFAQPKLISKTDTDIPRPKSHKKDTSRLSKLKTVQTPSEQTGVAKNCGDGLPLNLTDPTVQAEIIQMRDELREFHDLKAHHKLLEEQISLKIEQGSDNLTELQRETALTAQKITQLEPNVKTIALKLSKLLAQCPI